MFVKIVLLELRITFDVLSYFKFRILLQFYF